MRKHFLKLSFAIIALFAILLPAISLAAADVSVFDIKPTSTRFKITGVTIGTQVRVIVKNKTGTVSYSKSTVETVNSAIYFSSVFEGLTAGGSYTVVVADSNFNPLVQKDFTTPSYANRQLLYANLTTTSVTLRVSFYEPNKNITFRIKNNEPTDYYLQSRPVATDANGNASLDFSGLVPGGNYTAEVLIGNVSDKKVIFSTPATLTSVPPPSSAPTPPPATSGGNLASKGGGLIPPCPETGCGWNEFMILIANVIDFLIFYLSLPIAAIAFAYSGWLFMTSGDNPGNRTKAKGIFYKVALGLVIAMAAWLIVQTVLTTLVDEDLLNKYSLLRGIL